MFKNNLFGIILIVVIFLRIFGGFLGFIVFSIYLSWILCRKLVCVICKCKVFICLYVFWLFGLLLWFELKKKLVIKFNFLRIDIWCYCIFMILYYKVFYYNLN